MALELSLQTGNQELLVQTYFGYGFITFLMGQFDTAIHYMGEGLKRAEQIGFVDHQILGLTSRGAAYRCIENLDACAEYAGRGLELSEREEAHSYAATARANLGWIAWKQNDLRPGQA